MDEKKYSVVGKVEIGTDEYRDLIEAVATLKTEKNEQFSRYWTEHTRADKLLTELKDAKKTLAALQGFVDSSEEIKAKYRLYLVERQISEEEEQ